MDEMDMDPTAAVPDSPARFRQRFAVDKNSNQWRATDCPAAHDAESLFEQGRLARLLADSSEPKPFHQANGSTSRFQQNNVSNENKTVEANDAAQNMPSSHSNHIWYNKTMRNGKAQTAEIDSPTIGGGPRTLCRELPRNYTRYAGKLRDKGKAVDTRSASQALGKAMEPKGDHHQGCQRGILQWRPVPMGHVPPRNSGNSVSSTGKNANISDRVGYFAFAGTSKQDHSMVINSGPPLEYGRALPGQIHSDVPLKNFRQKKLVRNGCISPKNIAHLDSVAKGKGILGSAPGNLSIAASSMHMNPRCYISKEGSSDIRESEVRSNGYLDPQLHPVLSKPKIHSSFNEEAFGIAGVANDSLTFKTVLDHVEQAPRNESHGRGAISNATPSPINAVATLEPEPAVQHSQENHIKGKRKCNLVQSNVDETTHPILELTEASSCQTQGRRSNPKPTRFHNFTQHDSSSTCNMEVDVQNPLRYIHDGSESRITQVESDEILARRLQEQFDQESTAFGGTEEDNATFARALQQDDADSGRSITRHGHSFARDQSTDHLYRHHQRFPFQNSSTQLTNIARFPTSNRRFNSPEMDHEMTLIAQLTRGFRSHQMDLDMRLNILEALEAAFENSNDVAISDDLFPDYWDSDGDNYETLSALDDYDNQHTGASDMEINSLPVSEIQSDNCEDPCPICLESPSVGAVIRHLPCLHKFHKECIDTWLRRRSSCPVCKSGIA